MSVSLADSVLWAGLYGDPELAGLLDDAALLGAMIRTEAALAEACGAAGVIPEGAARTIVEELRSARVDPASLAAAAARDGVPVPALVSLLRSALSPDAAPYLHWGATSQDIMDTATVLRLHLALDVIDLRLRDILRGLAVLAEAQAETVMAARTRTQIALPSTFGAMVASWGLPLIGSRERLSALRPRLFRLSLHGAAGTDAALGERAPVVREHMGRALALAAPDLPWHSARDAMAELGATLTILTGALAKIGQDLIWLAQGGVAEVGLAGGGSSTMPHKSNPVVAEALVTLGRFTAQIQGAMFEAVIHGHARDGAAWALEWHALRQICVASGAALHGVLAALASLRVNAGKMEANLAAAGEGPYAEAAVFALAAHISRPEAEAAVKAALATPAPRDSLRTRFPHVDWAKVFDPLRSAGRAPAKARSFAALASGVARAAG